MAAVTVQPPYFHFKELDGTPLNNGNIYIGTAGLDPEANPITVYFDDTLLTTAAQPVRTINGYYSNAGEPADIFMDGTDFSITVRDSAGVLIFTKLNYDLTLPFTTFDFIPEATGAVSRGITSKVSDLVSVKDFGAVGDAVTDDTAAFVLAEALSQSWIYLPAGTYIVTGISLLKEYFGPGQIELDAVNEVRFFDECRTTIDGIGPIGSVVSWPTGTPPTNYLEIDGSTFSAVIYSELNTLLGGNTLPDMRGEFPRGWDNGRGVDSGRAILSTQTQDLQPHTHTTTTYDSLTTPAGAVRGTNAAGSTSTVVSGSTGTVETRPRNVALMYIMRAL